MKTLLVLSLLLSLLSSFQTAAVNNDGSPMTVTSFKWSRARQKVDVPEVQRNAPAHAMIPQTRNFARNARVNDPSDVVSVKTLADNDFKEEVLINRVEYSDGSIWQRNGWNLTEVKASYERVLREQWVPGTCKGL